MGKTGSAIATILLLLAYPLLFQKTSRAVTVEGEEVVLRSDGTQQFLSGIREYHKVSSATERIAMRSSAYAVSIDPEKWKEAKRERGRIILKNSDGYSWAAIIPQRTPIAPDAIKQSILYNILKVDPDAKIRLDEKRFVNGHEVLCLQFEGAVGKTALIYYGYYYAGFSGNVQVVAWTIKSKFTERMPDLTEFLNGLEIHDRVLRAETGGIGNPGAGRLSSNSEKVAGWPHSQKWMPAKPAKISQIALAHTKTLAILR